MTIRTTSYDYVLQELLEDPEFREDWERTAYVRAVANQIIRYRVEHGLSQTALARQLGVSQASVGRLELGEHKPKVSTLRRLSEKLGMRFSIDIHPQGQAPAAVFGADDERTERIIAGGVEMLVSAG